MIITIPLFIFLILYGLFLVVFAIFSLINITHIINTGSSSWASLLITFLIIALTILIFFGTWYFLRHTDWSYTVTIFNYEWFKNLFTGEQINNF